MSGALSRLANSRIAATSARWRGILRCMSETRSGIQGLCFRCAKPLGAGVRTDTKGRAYCAECVAHAFALNAAAEQQPTLRTGSAEIASVSAPAAPSATPEPVSTPRAKPRPAATGAWAPKRVAVLPKTTTDDEILDVAPLDTTTLTRAPCTACGGAMPVGADRCPTCGLIVVSTPENMSPRMPQAPPKPGMRVCRECGYDMAGLRQDLCPECGTVNASVSASGMGMGNTARSEYLDEVSREVEKEEYRKPLIMICIGLVAVVAFVSLVVGRTSGIKAATLSLTVYAVAFPFRVIVDVVAFWLCGLLWLGFDAPWKLTAWRFAGTLAVCDAVWILLGSYFGIFGFLVFGAIYALCLVQLFDLEWFDARIVAFITFVVNILAIWGTVAIWRML